MSDNSACEEVSAMTVDKAAIRPTVLLVFVLQHIMHNMIDLVSYACQQCRMQKIRPLGDTCVGIPPLAISSLHLYVD